MIRRCSIAIVLAIGLLALSPGRGLSSWQFFKFSGTPWRGSPVTRTSLIVEETPSPTPTVTPSPTPSGVVYDGASHAKVYDGTSIPDFTDVQGSGSNRIALILAGVSDSFYCETCGGYNLDDYRAYGTYTPQEIADSNRVIAYAPNGSSAIWGWVKKAPSAGNHVVSIVGRDVVDAAAGVLAFHNVNQTTPTGTAICTSGTGTPTVTVTGTTSGNVVVSLLWVEPQSSDPGLASATGGATKVWQETPGESGNVMLVAASYEASSGGSVAMGWSITAANGWKLCAIEVKQ